MVFAVQFIFIFDLHLCKHSIDLNLRWNRVLLSTNSAFRLRLMVLLLDINLLFADWTGVFCFEPLSNARLMETVETHQLHVFFAYFVV